MFQLLFGLIFTEMGLIFILLFKTPLRKLVIMALDRAKRGRGPLIVKSVAATVFIIMIYTIYSVQELYNRPPESFNPTDQVLLAYQLLQASLMGFSMFLAFMIDRLHHYMRELRMLRKTMENPNKQNRGFGDIKGGKEEDPNALKEEISCMRSKVNHLEAEFEAKEKELEAAKSSSESLRKQYDRLLEENQNLWNQFQSIEQSSSHSSSKKNM